MAFKRAGQAAIMSKRTNDFATFRRLGQWEDTYIEDMPAQLLTQTAVKCGYLEKEGAALAATFGSVFDALDQAKDLSNASATVSAKRRYFILWRHPDLTRGAYYLIWYESETSDVPSESIELNRGKCTLMNEKGALGSYTFSIKVTEEDEDDFKAVLSAKTFQERTAWMNAIDDNTQEVVRPCGARPPVFMFLTSYAAGVCSI